jgi:hypothetical protein
MLDGLMETELTVGRTGGVTVTVALLLLLLYVAVTVVVVVEVMTALPVTMKLPLVWPAEMVRLDGTETPELLAERLTTAPPESAAPVNVTVTVAFALLRIELGLIETELTVGLAGAPITWAEQVVEALCPLLSTTLALAV